MSVFESAGYEVLGGLQRVEQAQARIEKMIAGSDEARSQYSFHPFKLTEIRLLASYPVPMIADDPLEAFQPLHFDMGHPLSSVEGGNLYLLTGLYCPSTTRNHSAVTRVVPLGSLLGQLPARKRQHLQRTLGREMVLNPVEPSQMMCFSRLLQALHGEAPKWGMQSAYADYQQLKKAGLQAECKTYRSAGLDLAVVEQRIHLQPGELLILDNLRVIHGRLGCRQAGELVQLLFGIENAHRQQVKQLQDCLLSLFDVYQIPSL